MCVTKGSVPHSMMIGHGHSYRDCSISICTFSIAVGGTLQSCQSNPLNVNLLQPDESDMHLVIVTHKAFLVSFCVEGTSTLCILGMKWHK